ncbi:MAG TPA: hypothetical protein DHW02_07250, partial [Ktedonobacter sp.]|nr:hypothetical protein [Ktedonobacter sp.]
MQSANSLPPGGSTLNIAEQLRQQQVRHRRTLQMRTLEFWWPRVLTIILAAVVAVVLGQYVLIFPKPILIGIVAIVAAFFIVKYTEFGLLVMAVTATAFFPMAFQVKSLDVYPVLPVLLLLVFTLIIQTAFRVREFVWPSFWAIW